MGNSSKKLGINTGGSRKLNVNKDQKETSQKLNEELKPEKLTFDDYVAELKRKGPVTNKYDVNEKIVLGRGHYAVVFLGRCKETGRQVAVKRINILKSRLEALYRECIVLQRIGRHPNIVTLFDIFIGEGELYLVMEHLQGGELFDRMVEKGPYSEREASHHIRKIALALKYLHRHGIVHRDLKPENLILEDRTDESELKIADFGLSKVVDSISTSTMQTICGTWAYCAPEVKTSALGGNSASKVGCYTAAVDLWSVGVILFVILGAYHPFDADGDASDEQLWKNICSGEFDFDDPAWESISEQAKDLIRKLIVVDPLKRYTVDELLSHPWISQAGSVPATPITPSIDKSLRGFVSHKKGMTPKIGFGQPQMGFLPEGVQTAKGYQQNQLKQVNITQWQEHQQFSKQHPQTAGYSLQQPPQPTFGEYRQPVTNPYNANNNSNSNIMNNKIISSCGVQNDIDQGLVLNTLINKESDSMDVVN